MKVASLGPQSTIMRIAVSKAAFIWAKSVEAIARATTVAMLWEKIDVPWCPAVIPVKQPPGGSELANHWNGTYGPVEAHAWASEGTSLLREAVMDRDIGTGC